jgi:FtsP/CotA-like multicopper oxidase with cupredoxin domain
MIQMNRRALLASGAVAGAGVAMAPLMKRVTAQGGAPIVLTPFVDELPIPGSLNEALTVQGQGFEDRCFAWGTPKIHELIEAEGKHRFHRDLPETDMWLYNGQFPGPTFINKLGVPTLIRRINNLNPVHTGFGMPETSLHHHGGHQAPVDDGWPLDFIHPNQYRDHLIPNIAPEGDQREWPSTLWYHDHTIDYTAGNVYRGLAGLSLHFDDIDSGNENDTNPQALRLPSGQYDIPLVFRDVALNADGSLFFDQLNIKGQVGNLMTINGKIKPYLKVARRKYRFRILIGGMAREYRFQLSDKSPFQIIASDGGLLETPVTTNVLHQANAERYEIVVDFSRYQIGQQITLDDHVVQIDGNKPEGFAAIGNPLLLFVVDGDAPDPSQVLPTLRPLPPIELNRVVATRRLVLGKKGGMWTINDKVWNPLKPLFRPKLNTFELWNVSVSGGGWNHPLHIHQEFFRILKRAGKTPPAHERGKKDVVLVNDKTPVQLYVGFRTFTGPYVFHCHNLGHEDLAMMGWYDVQP